MSVDLSRSSSPVTGTVEAEAARPVGTGIPRWIRTLDRVHSSSRSTATVVADAGVLLVSAFAAHSPWYPAVAITFTMLVAFNLCRVYVPRSSLESQGVFWYPARIAAPFAIIALGWAEQATRLRGTVEGTPIDAPRFAMYGALGLVGLRVVTWTLLHILRRRGKGLQRTVIVGRGVTARGVSSKLAARPEAGLQPIGILAPDGPDPGEGVGLGRQVTDLPAVIRESGVTHVVLVPEGDHDVQTSSCLELCDGMDVWFSLMPPMSELFMRPSLVTQVAGLPLIPLGKATRPRGTMPGKRTFDLIVASLMLVVLSPVLLLAAIAVKVAHPGPLLYRQRRVGRFDEPFMLLKFRSMIVGADEMMDELLDRNESDGLLFKVRDDPRVTPVGRVLRRLSIDELPQLWNVIRGEMSLVGPRPLAVEPEDFGPVDGRRHSVRPGITGYWQIAGGNGLTYAEMVKLDLVYIQNWSLWLDVRLLGRTAPSLVHRRGPW